MRLALVRRIPLGSEYVVRYNLVQIQWLGQSIESVPTCFDLRPLNRKVKSSR